LTKFTGDFTCLPKISKPKCRDFFVTDYLYKQQNTLEKYQTGKKTPKKKKKQTKKNHQNYHQIRFLKMSLKKTSQKNVKTVRF